MFYLSRMSSKIAILLACLAFLTSKGYCQAGFIDFPGPGEITACTKYGSFEDNGDVIIPSSGKTGGYAIKVKSQSGDFNVDHIEIAINGIIVWTSYGSGMSFVTIGS